MRERSSTQRIGWASRREKGRSAPNDRDRSGADDEPKALRAPVLVDGRQGKKATQAVRRTRLCTNVTLIDDLEFCIAMFQIVKGLVMRRNLSTFPVSRSHRGAGA